MADDASGEVPVTFAKGVLDDVAEVTATATGDDQARKDEAEALKRRIAELLVECKGNPFNGELMGAGLHPELADCRRVRFDIPTQSEAAVSPDLPQPARRRRSRRVPRLTIAPRAGLRPHRKAQQRSRSD